MGGVYVECGHWNRSIWLKLNEMRKKGVACDVELVADDCNTRFPVHLCILAAGSPHLKSQLLGVAHIKRSTQVRMSGFSAQVLESVLEFMYTGSLIVQNEPIVEVEKAAKALQMRQLAMLCNKVSEKQKAASEESEHFIMLENSLWHKTLWHNLNVLRTLKQFCNLTLQIDSSSSVDTHACLLLAASSFFRKNIPISKLEEGESLCLELAVEAASVTAVRNVLDYIYLGSFSCTSQNLQATMDIASTFKLEELVCLLQGILNKHNIPKISETEEKQLNIGKNKYDEEIVVTVQEASQLLETHEEDEAAATSEDTSHRLEQIHEVNSEQLQALLKKADDFRILQPDGEAVSVVMDASQLVVPSDSVDRCTVVDSNGVQMDLSILNEDLNSDINKQPGVFISEQSDNSGNAIPEMHPTYDAELTAYLADKTKQKKTASGREILYDVLPIVRDLEIMRSDTGLYLCPHCEKSFRKKYEAQVHAVIHTGQRPYVCRVCGMGFKFKTNVMAHLKRHIGHKPYHCKTCGKHFLRLWDQKVHERTHTKEKPYKCMYCPKRFAQSANRYTHIKFIHHRVKKPSSLHGDFECLQCGKHFNTSKGLLSHESTHLGWRKPVVCETCGDSFFSIYSLRRHVRRGACKKNMGTKKRYNELKVGDGDVQTCAHCSQTFDDFEALRDHLLTSGCMEQMENPPHYFRINNQFVCFRCSTTFATFRSFREHDEGRDCDRILGNDSAVSPPSLLPLPKLPLPKLPLPPAKAQNPKGQESQNASSMGFYLGAGSRLVCVPCGASFVNIRSLRRHKTRAACEKNVRRRLLDSKINVISVRGDGDKGRGESSSLCCEQCGESLSQPKVGCPCETRTTLDGDLIHRDQYKQVIRVQTLQQHELQVHNMNRTIKQEVVDRDEAMIPNKKLFACSDCGSSFATADSVRRHKTQGACQKVRRDKATNLDEKLFACSDCGSSFSTADLARRHKRRGTCNKDDATNLNNKLFECGDCGSAFSTAGSVRRHKRRGACDKILGIKLKRSDDTRQKVECKGCWKLFASRDSLRKHIKGGACTGSQAPQMQKQKPRYQPGQYKCLVCHSVVQSYSELRKHIEECARTPDGGVLIKAAMSKSQHTIVKVEHGEGTDTQVVLKTINKSSANDDTKIIQEEFCKEVIADGDVVGYTCEVCQKTLEMIDDFDEHWQEEHSVKCSLKASSEGLGDCYICPYCVYITKLYVDFKEHVYNCLHFPVNAVRETYLYRNNTSCDDKPDTTSTESPSGNKGQDDRVQVKVESKADTPNQTKPKVTISYTACDEQFSNVEELTNHQNTQHELVKSPQTLIPLVCEVCDKTFESKNGLNEHHKNFPNGSCETPEKKTRATVMHSCEKCDLKFSSVPLLRLHYIHDHNFVLCE